METKNIYYVLYSHIDKAYPHSSYSKFSILSSLEKAKEVAIDIIDDLNNQDELDDVNLIFDELFSKVHGQLWYYYSSESEDWIEKIDVYKGKLNLDEELIFESS